MINIALYQPEIPPNTGNIARSCALTETRLHLIKPLGFSIDDRALKRAGLDYWHLLDLVVHESLDDFLQYVGAAPVYLATTKATQYYHQVSYEADCYIVFGKETAGLPQDLHDRYQKGRIKLPMRDHSAARSLNLSNAVNIILYEVLRQHGFKTLI